MDYIKATSEFYVTFISIEENYESLTIATRTATITKTMMITTAHIA